MQALDYAEQVLDGERASVPGWAYAVIKQHCGVLKREYARDSSGRFSSSGGGASSKPASHPAAAAPVIAPPPPPPAQAPASPHAAPAPRPIVTQAAKPPAATKAKSGAPPAVAHAKLAPAEGKAMGDYQGNFGGSSTEVNKALRSGGKPGKKMQERIASIESAISKQKFTKDGVVHRGIQNPRVAQQYAKMQPGNVFVEHGFVSTSSDNKLAERWATKRGVVLHISVSKDQSGLDMNHHVDSGSDEKEILLGHGRKFSVEKVQDKGGQRHIHVRML